jgi:CGNR zinc finger
MPVVPEVTPAWVVDLVNEYGHRPREAAGESGDPYPPLADGAPSTAGRMRRSELVELADRLWPVFDQHEQAARVEALNSLLTAAELTPGVDAAGAVTWTSRHRAGAALTAAGCAVALLTEVTRGGWAQLGVCDGADCVDVHVHGRGRRRRYCSTACLNRARVRAYRARR